MKHRTHIPAIYRKELLDILRDRRTMIAMVVVPVVLYPVLMLGFVWAAQHQEEQLRAERFVVEVDDDRAQSLLTEMIAADPLESQPSDSIIPPTTQPTDPPPEKSACRVRFDVQAGHTPATELGDAVQLRVAFSPPAPSPTPETQPIAPLEIRLIYNEIDARSRTAMQELSDVLVRVRQRMTRERLSALLSLSNPAEPVAEQVNVILEPLRIKKESTASEVQRGGWAMGQIIPLILVLMTITGAVYPAIDLTAGERERGTLETLLTTPVPMLHLIVGKFLVVATIGMLTAILNLASVGATMQFSGLTSAITAEMPVKFPLHMVPLVLLCLIPFALFFSAILMAVCSFARTFKEAQNYVGPVIIAALIPASAVTLPAVRLEGIMLVLPVGNVVLLARELFQQTYTISAVVIVLLCTSLYAAAAIALAARLFGQEAVMFTDAGSYRAMFRRQYFKPASSPSLSQALLLIALLFPASFYLQSIVGGRGEHFIRSMSLLAVLQFAGLFVAVPMAITIFFKIDWLNTFKLRTAQGRAWIGVILLGCSSGLLAHEFAWLQQQVMPLSESMKKSLEQLSQQIESTPLPLILLLFAMVPAITEELLFRGFVLSGLSAGLKKWPAIILMAAIFGLYHFTVDRLAISMLLGVVLGYICWQSRSIFPGMVFHILHNGLLMLATRSETLVRRLGIVGDETALTSLPPRTLVPAVAVFVVGLVIIASIRHDNPKPSMGTPSV